MRLSALALILVAGCATQQPVQKEAPAAPAKEVAAPPPEPPKFVADLKKPMPPGLDEAAMDLSADPCADFYQYACGGWMAKTEIPADRPLYSRGFVSILERNEALQKTILEEAAANKLPEGTAFAKQLGDYYATCTDEAGLEKALPEVKKFIDQVAKVKDAKSLATSVGTIHAAGFRPFFDIGAIQDLKNSTEVIGSLDQSGLGLPDRDYYFDEDKKTVREQYKSHVEAMFGLLGLPAKDCQRKADEVMAIETRLAKVAQTRVERRDPNKLYNRINRDGLTAQAKDFAWDAYFTAVGAKDLKAINVNSVPYFVEVAAIAKDTKPELLNSYLTWVVLRSTTPALPKVFQDEAFNFSSKALTGAKADRPRWKKCVAYTDGDLGEALGREFVRRAFGEDGKARTSAMVESLQKSFEANLASLSWFDEPTRKAAFEKVTRMVGNNKIGYPGTWRDYAKLTTSRTSFFGNSLAANRFEVQRQLAKIGKPVDRNEWLMSPPTVNAYYDPQKNEIVFPAGILQPPFFDRAATDAVNFGSMGMVVGHEITHGFDDEGRQFDVDGNIKDWWSASVGKAFVEKASCVKKQFDGYTAIGDVKVKGDLTLGENIADLGGLKLAHAAMADWYAKKGDADSQFRFSRSQQFFLGFAQSWCTKVRDETAKVRAATDPHAPPFARVKGPLGNLDAFQTAFQCSEKAAMIRRGADRCVVW
ncbi:MAG: M13 family metallopeptidase [Archangiaceae bacterium]|nr:M13 family metallopeptidase [Archangiaceae bacterium]